jgi:hypothetical protein
MAKRLLKKKAPSRSRRPGRTVRVAGTRPNRFHTFLKRLHSGGRSNMYGAIPYLMHAFALDREAAFRIVCEWVDQQAEQASRSAEASSGP